MALTITRCGGRAGRLRRAAMLVSGALAATASLAAAQGAGTRTGVIGAVWDAGPTPALPQFVLVERTGRATPLAIDSATLAAAGGLDAIDRQEVTVQVDAAGAAAAPLRVRSLRVTRPALRSSATLPTTTSAGPIGPLTAPSLPFVTLLCRFADTPGAALPQRAAVERTHGPNYPGAQHFFTEQAFGSNVLAGSAVAPEWVTIGPRASYVPFPQAFDSYRAGTDCAAAAEAAGQRVSGYYGINFQFSGPLSNRSTPPYDVLSLGGSFTRVTGAGTTETFGATWLSAEHATQYVVVEHEMGHAFGWPHSEFEVGREYDSEWDVMSVGYIGYAPEFGFLPSGTIAPNKQRRGWINAAATTAPASGSVRTARLRALARSWPGGADTSAYMARIPMAAGLGCEYSVEARQRVGYDAVLKGEGVLIHQACSRPRLIGPPGVTRGDRDAAWQPGSQLADSVGGVYVRVDSTVRDGYAVTLTRGWPLTVRVIATEGARGTVTVGPTVCADGCTVAAGTRGEELRPTPTPAPGAMFLGWQGACTGTDPGCAVSMQGHREVAARFGLAVTIATTGARRAALVGAPYADTLRAAGGTGEYRWAVTAGAPPEGVVLDPATGVLRGTPARAGAAEFTVSATSLGSTATATVLVRVSRQTTVVSDSVRPDAVRGVAYADSLRVDAEAGSARWAITAGALPAGIALDAESGRLTGTPTEAGTARFTAAATVGGSTASRAFVLRVRRPTAVLSEAERPAATLGVAYLDTLRGEWEPGATVSWSVAGGALPAGLALDAATGVVSGTPTRAERAQFVGRVSADGVSATRDFSIVVGRAFVIASDSVRRRAVAGLPYADTLRASEAAPDGARWTVTVGALPAGLALDAATGVVSGTPTAPEVARFTVTVAGDGVNAARAFVLAVLRRTTIAGDSVRRAALRSVAYADTLRAEAEPGALTWRVVAGTLPDGLALDSATGVVRGVPTAAGTARFTVRAASELSSDTRALTLAVLEPPRIVSEPERRGTVIGEAYADTLRLAGDGAARWSLVDGALPPGLVLVPETGVVSGVAERAGSFRYTVEAAPMADRRTFSVQVTAPTLAAADVLDQLLGGTAALPPARVAYLDLIGNRNGRLDVGDVRAWLVSTGALTAASPLAEVVPALERAAARADAADSPPTPESP